MIRGELVLQELKKWNVTHVVGLPDNSSAQLIALLGREPEMRFITVTREGEAFAIAAGLWMGGGQCRQDGAQTVKGAPQADSGKGIWPGRAIGRVDFYQNGLFDGLVRDGVEGNGVHAGGEV